eukprot:Skav214909  [mRNA]  locus=scaffold3783:64025:67659:- [translate_table: standard]
MHTSGLGYGPSRERKTEKLSSDGKTEGVYMDLVKRIDSGRIKNLKCFCEELAKLPLQFHPGDRWEYSMGLDVLGRVLEVVSGFAVTTKQQVLKPSTVNLLCRDWLRMKSVSEKQKLRGWGMGRDVGWCPLGHWMPKERCLAPTEAGVNRLMFMGGITTNWSIKFPTRTLQVSMTSSSCEADEVHNWDDRKDDLSGALEHAEKVWRRKRRSTGSPRHGSKSRR